MEMSNMKIFKMMICEHLRKDEDGVIPFCADCGLYLNDKAATAILKATMDTVTEGIASEIGKSTKNYGDDRRHLRKDEDGGTPFCADCGLVFEDETVFVSECHNMNNHYSGYGQIHHHPRDDHASPIAEAKPEPVESTPVPTDTKPPTSVKDLRKIAKERGIKYYTTMSKKDLCTALGLEVFKPTKLIFKNKKTGEEHRFHSIYKASKVMGINPGLMKYYLGKETSIDGTIYTISNV